MTRTACHTVRSRGSLTFVSSRSAARQRQGSPPSDPLAPISRKRLDNVGKKGKGGKQPNLHLACLQRQRVADASGEIGVQVSENSIPNGESERLANRWRVRRERLSSR
jgi:hypothetical protein